MLCCGSQEKDVTIQEYTLDKHGSPVQVSTSEKNRGNRSKSCFPNKDRNDNHPEDGVFLFMDGEEYNFSHPKRGLAVIINNELFISRSKFLKDRSGSSLDANALFESFKALGFDVLVFNNLKLQQMVQVLKSAIKNYDHSQVDCFACTILTHGHQVFEKDWNGTGTSMRLDVLFGIDEKAIATNVLVEMFNDTNCPSLKGKPRLFFIQASRGEKLDDGHSIHRVKKTAGIHYPHGGDVKDFKHKNDKSQQKSSSSSQKNNEGGSSSAPAPPSNELRQQLSLPKYENPPLYQDCLVMYSIPPGHHSWRRLSGAWFIQCLCKMFDSNVLEHVSLLRGLSYVCGKVAREYRSKNPKNRSMHGKQAVPVVESNLVKEVYLKKKTVQYVDIKETEQKKKEKRIIHRNLRKLDYISYFA